MPGLSQHKDSVWHPGPVVPHSATVTVALCLTPTLMRYMAENSNLLLHGPLLKGGGGGISPK